MSKQGMYRGQRVDNGEWFYGSLTVHNAYDLNDGTHKPEGEHVFIRKRDIEWISDPNNSRWTFVSHEVIPSSVGQSTGLKDMEGVEIFGGDIVKLCYGIPPTYDTLVIEYADDEVVGDISVSGWWMRNIRDNGLSGSLCKTYECDLEVIGKTTDNPELLETDK